MPLRSCVFVPAIASGCPFRRTRAPKGSREFYNSAAEWRLGWNDIFPPPCWALYARCSAGSGKSRWAAPARRSRFRRSGKTHHCAPHPPACHGRLDVGYRDSPRSFGRPIFTPQCWSQLRKLGLIGLVVRIVYGVPPVSDRGNRSREPIAFPAFASRLRRPVVGVAGSGRVARVTPRSNICRRPIIDNLPRGYAWCIVRPAGANRWQVGHRNQARSRSGALGGLAKSSKHPFDALCVGLSAVLRLERLRAGPVLRLS